MNCDYDVTVTHAVLCRAQIHETQHPKHSKDIKLCNPISHTCFVCSETVSPTLLLLNQLQQNESILFLLSLYVSIKWITTNG